LLWDTQSCNCEDPFVFQKINDYVNDLYIYNKKKKWFVTLLTYGLSLPPVKKAKSIALKTSKGKSKNSSEEESNDEDGIAMLARNFKHLLNSKGDLEGTGQEEVKTNKWIIMIQSMLNVQVLGTSKLIVETSSKRKENLFMLLLVINQVKIRGFWLLLLHMLILRSPRVEIKKN
jgi:hypothetical protein